MRRSYAEVMAFIGTSPFRRSEPQYSRSMLVPLRRPGADTAGHRRRCAGRTESDFSPGLSVCTRRRDPAGYLAGQSRGCRQAVRSQSVRAAGRPPRSSATDAGTGCCQRPLGQRYPADGIGTDRQSAKRVGNATAAADAGLHDHMGWYADRKGIVGARGQGRSWPRPCISSIVCDPDPR